MENEVISNKQEVCLMILFIIGSTLVLGTWPEAEQDAWIAVIIGVFYAIPVVTIYSRILLLFPEKDLFQILEIIFGRIIGKVVCLLFIWYAFHLGALVIRNFSEFIKIAGLLETPELVPAMFLVLLCIWGVKEGIEVLGRWSQFVLPILIGMLLLTVILSIPKADYSSIRPILHNNLSPVLKASFSVFTFPFAETVVFIMVLNGRKNQKGHYKAYLTSILLGGFIVVIITMRNMVVLGYEFVAKTYFPAYVTVSLINIADFLQRIEIIVSVVFLFAGFIKISICLLATCNGVARILNLTEYRALVAPIGLIMMSLSFLIYDSMMEMQDWAFLYYKYYALPFQVIMPLIIWIVCEIKAKRVDTKKLAKNA